MNTLYKNAPYVKRILAGLIDFAIAAIFSIFFIAVASSYILPSWAHTEIVSIQEINAKYNLIDRVDYNISSLVYSDSELKAIYEAETLYQEYLAEGKIEEASKYYAKARDYCVEALSCNLDDVKIGNYGDEIATPYLNLAIKSQLVIMLAMVFVAIPFYLIIPILLKNGQTIGKRMFSLAVKLSKGGGNVKVIHLLARLIVYIVLEIYLSFIYGLILPIVLSVVVMLLTAKHYMIHDVLSLTYVVDLKQQEYLQFDPTDPSQYIG